ncbi:MAG: hypothetical protein JWO82_279 [Akkermansiaceae bacterium]|nr:hypothetical protein [Akkermansiaceae bacterium]
MTIHEPATLATDYLLSALGVWLAVRLQRRISVDNVAAIWWCLALLAMAASAFVGGSYHGFAPNLSAGLADGWWKGVLAIIVLLALAMEFSLVREVVAAQRQMKWLLLSSLKAAVALAAVLKWPLFAVVMADYGLAMLFWAAAAVMLRRPWAGWMLGGVVLSGVAGWVQRSGFGLGAFFDHNAVFHVIQVLAIYGFYRGGLILGKGRRGYGRSGGNWSRGLPTRH